MPVYIHRSELNAPPAEAFAWHERPGALERLLPPWERLRVLEREGGVADGARALVALRLGPLRLRWEARHRDYEAGRSFRDEQVRGPFARWVHTHRFLEREDGGTTLEDEVDYRLPLAPLSTPLNGLVRRRLARTFRLRHGRVADDLARHQRFAGAGPQRVVISGASGLIGGRLAPFLTAGGHTVQRLVRRTPRAEAGEVGWQPESGEIDAAALEGADAVVHLAGENVAGGRWTARRRRAILESRLQGTETLCRALAGLERKPRVLISASGINYYGSRGEEPLDEAADSGEGFLAEVCRAWEGATAPAREAGIRVVNLRIGMVIAGEGGALPQLLPPFLAGVGGRLGSGRQYMSWIALEDLIGAMHHLLFTGDVSGPVNAVAPEALPNAAFTRTLGRVLRRPTPFPVPAPVLRLALGRMADEMLLGSQLVQPTVLQAKGFPYLFPTLEEALRTELGRWRAP